MGRGVTVKDALNGVAGVGGHKKLFVGGGGTEGTTTPALPPKKVLLYTIQWVAFVFLYQNF